MAFPLSLIVKNDSESDNESGVESHDHESEENDDATHGEIDAEMILT